MYMRSSEDSLCNKHHLAISNRIPANEKERLPSTTIEERKEWLQELVRKVMKQSFGIPAVWSTLHWSQDEDCDVVSPWSTEPIDMPSFEHHCVASQFYHFHCQGRRIAFAYLSKSITDRSNGGPFEIYSLLKVMPNQICFRKERFHASR